MIEALPSTNRHPTGNCPADPSPLNRRQLEGRYQAMRCSHEFPVRSRAQLQRRSRALGDKRQDLPDTMYRYRNRRSALGRERVEEFEASRDSGRTLEAFARDQQEVDQLPSQVEDASGEGGVRGILKVTRLLKQIRQLLRGGGPGQ